jgi:hypothetical protein
MEEIMADHQAQKIMIIRHGEKPSGNPPPHGVNPHGEQDTRSLSVRGWTRAGALVGLFASPNEQTEHPQLATPEIVYATAIGQGSESARMQQTVTPLLDRLADKVESDFSFLKGREQEMIESALANEGVVLICWEHDRLPHAAKGIPLSANNQVPIPEKWEDERFDLVWVFDRDENGEGYLFSIVPQLVLGGDAYP